MILIVREIADIVIIKITIYGGENLELVSCSLPICGQKLVKKTRAGVAIVGTTTDDTDILLIDSQGIYPNEQLILSQGFQHFSKSYLL